MKPWQSYLFALVAVILALVVTVKIPSFTTSTDIIVSGLVTIHPFYYIYEIF